MIPPAIIAHADWGTDRRKRQVATARLTTRSGAEPHYTVHSLAPAPEARDASGGLLHELRAAALPGQLMIGFDFPIGLPQTYARAAGIAAFPPVPQRCRLAAVG